MGMVSYSGSGKSLTDPIMIHDVDNHTDAMNAEYAYLRKEYGVRDVDWKLVIQSLITVGTKYIDQLEIELADGQKLTVFFDISEHWGKF